MTYPNILIKGYLKEVGKLTPEASMKLDQAISMGYQRLLTFEVGGGGFDWYGRAPANVILTAYGMLQFSDMAKVYDVDAAIIRRAASWLVARQRSDGSWEEKHSPHNLNIGNAALATTAFAVWALAETGTEKKAVTRGRHYLSARLSQTADPYTLAIAAKALGSIDPNDAAYRGAIEQLRGLTQREWDRVWWLNQGVTTMYGCGRAGAVETTALGALAFDLARSEPAITNGALGYLISAKDPQGAWYSTQATILAMKALLAGSKKSASNESATVAISVNGKEAAHAEVNPTNSDLMQMFDLRDHLATGENTVDLRMAGQANLSYQVSARYYIPWKTVQPPKESPLAIDVAYDKTSLQVDDTLGVRARISYRGAEPTFMVIVDLGIPPGFVPDPGQFEDLVLSGKVDKFSLTGRQVTLYLGDLKPGDELEVAYSLKAKYPVRAKTPESRVYEYYNPDRQAMSAPAFLEVR